MHFVGYQLFWLESVALFTLEGLDCILILKKKKKRKLQNKENPILLPFKNHRFLCTWTRCNCSQTDANKSNLVLRVEKYKNWTFIHFTKKKTQNKVKQEPKQSKTSSFPVRSKKKKKMFSILFKMLCCWARHSRFTVSLSKALLSPFTVIYHTH